MFTWDYSLPEHPLVDSLGQQDTGFGRELKHLWSMELHLGQGRKGAWKRAKAASGEALTQWVLGSPLPRMEAEGALGPLSKGSQGSGLVPNTRPLKGHQMVLPKEQGNSSDRVPCHFSSLQGHLTTCGLVQCLGTLMEEDSVLVKVLKKQGAIPFAMTNVPQSLYR